MKSALWVLLGSLLPFAVQAGSFSGEIRTLGGYDSNPSGYTGGEAQGLGATQAKLTWRVPLGDASGDFRVTYLGNLSAFTPRSEWTAHSHELSGAFSQDLEDNLNVGFRGGAGGNWNRPAYDAYSYREFFGEGWAQTELDGWPVYASLAGNYRNYPASPSFDFREFTMTAYTSRYWATRTTFRLTFSATERTYITQTIEDFFAGQTNATSSQFQISALASQGLTDRSGLRFSGWALSGSGRTRWRDDYLEAMDDPLATRGVGGRVQFSVLAPLSLTFRTYLGGQRTTQAYITQTGEYGDHTDTIREAGVVLEGKLPRISTRLSWSTELNAQRRTSSDPTYAFDRAALTVGVKYAW
ncbi:MAG TPA: hypothetical protein P5179_04750 [Candidatus Latescibacteria bacterium]|nr:hypothetical protein [Candidatus Latescibacterota bacterium]